MTHPSPIGKWIDPTVPWNNRSFVLNKSNRYCFDDGSIVSEAGHLKYIGEQLTGFGRGYFKFTVRRKIYEFNYDIDESAVRGVLCKGSVRVCLVFGAIIVMLLAPSAWAEHYYQQKLFRHHGLYLTLRVERSNRTDNLMTDAEVSRSMNRLIFAMKTFREYIGWIFIQLPSFTSFCIRQWNENRRGIQPDHKWKLEWSALWLRPRPDDSG